MPETPPKKYLDIAKKSEPKKLVRFQLEDDEVTSTPAATPETQNTAETKASEPSQESGQQKSDMAKAVPLVPVLAVVATLLVIVIAYLIISTLGS